MKKYNLIIFIACLLAKCAFTQNSILIEIRPGGSDVSSFILATTPNNEIVNYNFYSSLIPIISSVNMIAFTALPEKYEVENMVDIMRSSSTLKGYYKREDNIRFELMVRDKLKTDIEKYWGLKPLYILELLRQKDFDAGYLYQQQKIFDLTLQKTKPVTSLLNAHETAGLMEQVDFETQAAILSNYVNREKEFRKNDVQNFNAYVQENLNTIAENNAKIELPAYENIFEDAVNSILANKIEEMSKQQSTLFILDANMLMGQYGIIKKLNDAAFSTNDKFFPVYQNESSNIYAGTNTELNADNFPLINTIQTAEVSTNEIPVLINITDTALLQTRYLAYDDPFGDLLDYSTIDTSFLNKWYYLKAEEGNFSVKIPVQSQWEESITETVNGTIKSYSASVNHARSDLYYSVGYTLYPPGFDPGMVNQFFDDVIYRSVRKLKGDLLAQRLISTPTYSGREFTVIVSDSFFVRSKLILKGNILYQLLAGGPKDNVYSGYAAAFFNSFQFTEAAGGGWAYYENNLFNCYLPTTPLISGQTYNTQNGVVNVQTFSAQDYKIGISYFISINSYPADYKYKSEKSFYDDMIAGAEKQYVGTATQIKSVKKNGMTGKYVEMQLNNNNVYKIYFFFQNNILYQYLAGGTQQAMSSANPQYFFDNFYFAGEKK